MKEHKDLKIVKIAIGIALGGIILYYLIRICNGEFVW